MLNVHHFLFGKSVFYIHPVIWRSDPMTTRHRSGRVQESTYTVLCCTSDCRFVHPLYTTTHSLLTVTLLINLAEFLICSVVTNRLLTYHENGLKQYYLYGTRNGSHYFTEWDTPCTNVLVIRLLICTKIIHSNCTKKKWNRQNTEQVESECLMKIAHWLQWNDCC